MAKTMNTAASESLAGKKVLGIDLGSRNVKTAVMRDGRVIMTSCIETMSFYRDYGVRGDGGFTVDLEAVECPDAACVVATGYGRFAAALSGAENVSELSAHFLGARFQTGLDDFTLLDMGGQDYKVLSIRGGRIVDMATNDKCAASTGRYLENMAGVLGMTLDELGRYRDNPAVLSSTCAIFGESELIGLVVGGVSTDSLAAGVNRAVVERVLPLIDRMNSDTIVMSGGVALNPAVVSILGEMSGSSVVIVDDPLHNGAVGCCVKARSNSGKV